MTENFYKLKKKILYAAIIKSAVIGLSAGLFVAGVLLLALSLSNNSIFWGFYVLIGVGVAAISGGVSFLLMRPTDMKVAKKYDNKYSLNEKLQTMVAFAGQEGDIFALQREDAAQALAGVPAQKISLGLIWHYCVIALLALVMIFLAVFIPAAAQEGENPDPDNPDNPVIGDDPNEENEVFEYDLFMQSAIGELISNVRASSLEKAEKDAVVAVLETLDSNLNSIDTKGSMHTAVVSAIAVIDGIFYNANSFRKISGEVEKFDENIAKAMRAGIAVYNSSSAPLTDINRVKAFESRLGDLIEIALEGPLENSAVSLKVPQNGKTDEETGEVVKLADVLPQYVESFEKYLQDADKDDQINASLESFKNSLNKTLTKLGKGYKDETLFTEMDTAYTALSTNLNAALNVQCYNCVMNLFVREKLAAIFGIDAGELPSFNDDLKQVGSGSTGDDDPGNTGDDDPNGNGGGNGKYDFVFGSDDMIYDPDSATQVSYGEVLDEYYAKVQNKIIAGEVSEELADILKSYFEILYNGLKDNTEST